MMISGELFSATVLSLVLLGSLTGCADGELMTPDVEPPPVSDRPALSQGQIDWDDPSWWEHEAELVFEIEDFTAVPQSGDPDPTLQVSGQMSLVLNGPIVHELRFLHGWTAVYPSGPITEIISEPDFVFTGDGARSKGYTLHMDCADHPELPFSAQAQGWAKWSHVAFSFLSHVEGPASDGGNGACPMDNPDPPSFPPPPPPGECLDGPETTPEGGGPNASPGGECDEPPGYYCEWTPWGLWVWINGEWVLVDTWEEWECVDDPGPNE